MKPFEVSVEMPRKLLRMTLRGFWDIPTFNAFAIEFEQGLQTLHRAGGCAAAIVDGHEFAVQSKEILGLFSELMRKNARYLAKRVASIIPTELNRMQAAHVRMQAAHVTDSLTRRDFRTIADAEAWLFSEQTDRAA